MNNTRAVALRLSGRGVLRVLARSHNPSLFQAASVAAFILGCGVARLVAFKDGIVV